VTAAHMARWERCSNHYDALGSERASCSIAYRDGQVVITSASYQKQNAEPLITLYRVDDVVTPWDAVKQEHRAPFSKIPGQAFNYAKVCCGSGVYVTI
jgi:hypothetical protein